MRFTSKDRCSVIIRFFFYVALYNTDLMLIACLHLDSFRNDLNKCFCFMIALLDLSVMLRYGPCTNGEALDTQRMYFSI